jgi:hypothetical protein
VSCPYIRYAPIFDRDKVCGRHYSVHLAWI